MRPIATAFLRHTWLLMTCRHPMTGLPREAPGLGVTICTLSAMVAAIRESNPVLFVVYGVVLGAAPIWGGYIDIVCAYAMLTLGIDVVAILVETMLGEGRLPIFTVWLAIGACPIVSTLVRRWYRL